MWVILEIIELAPGIPVRDGHAPARVTERAQGGGARSAKAVRCWSSSITMESRVAVAPSLQSSAAG